MSKKKKVDPIPGEFTSYEEAAEFWDKHDTAHYPGEFRTVKVVSELRNRHYEIPIDGDVAVTLQKKARRAGVPPRALGQRTAAQGTASRGGKNGRPRPARAAG
ncbi:MAG: CopG family antitoxin [Terriglobia bacterium]